jgi:hypothetical protein
MLLLWQKEDLADMIKLRILRWRNFSGETYKLSNVSLNDGRPPEM